MLEMRRMQRIFSLEKIRTHLSLWTTSPPPQQGFPVAHVQLLLPVEAAPSTSPSAPAAGDGALEVSNFPGGITIKGAGIEVEVSFELKALERSPHRALLQPPFQPLASSFPFFFAVFDSSLRAASYALVRITCNPNSDHVQPQLATLSTPSSLRSRPGPASSRAGPSPALTSWPSPSCPASTALPLTTTAAGPGATATPTGAGLEGKKGLEFSGAWEQCFARAAKPLSLRVERQTAPSHLTLTNFYELQIAFFPPQSTGGRKQASTAWPWSPKRSNWRRKRPRKVASRCVLCAQTRVFGLFFTVFRRFGLFPLLFPLFPRRCAMKKKE